MAAQRGVLFCKPSLGSLSVPWMSAALSALSQAFQISLKSTQGPIDVFLCPEDSSGVCSPVKSPFKAAPEDSTPGSSQTVATSPLLHPAQDVNMPVLTNEQGEHVGAGHALQLPASEDSMCSMVWGSLDC